jgi:cytoskeleton protein RodZ
MAEIGSTLREARMRAHIDITEVEASTKIRAKYLRALENDEWDLLPGPVYVRSFLKTYSDYLGLDSRLLVDDFKRRYERPTEQELVARASAGRERERRHEPSRLAVALLSPRGLIGIALVAIVIALGVIGSQVGKKNAGNITPRVGAAGTSHHKGTTRAAGHQGTHISTTGTSTTPTGTMATVTLVPTSTVWICVENQAGKPLIPATDYSSGQSIPTLSAGALLVTLGNTSVTMTADGKLYPLSGGRVTSLKITPQGITSLTTAPKCGA